MEKNQQLKQTHQEKEQKQANKRLVWDCGSTLYDSFELRSFERQLNSAIHSRTLSMPHLPDRKVVAPAPPPLPNHVSKKPSKISRSLQKFLKSLFKSKQTSCHVLRVPDRTHDEYYVIYDKSGALTTIPEGPEIDFGGFSPEINSLVRRTASERVAPAASIGISCA